MIAILSGSHAPDALADDDNEAKARAAFKEGVRAAQRGDYQRALSYYRKSYDLKPHPRTMFNLAAVAEHLDRDDEAYKAYQNFLRTATERDKELVVEANRRVAELGLKLQSDLHISSNPAGAAVFIDGNSDPAGQTPFKVTLPPGNHVLRFEAAGRKVISRNVEMRPNVDDKLSVDIPASAVELRIRSNVRGAKVEVDGELIGTTSLLQDGPLVRDVVPGDHEIIVAKSGYLDLDEALTLQEARAFDVEVALNRPRSTANWIVLGSMAGLGVASAGVAAWYGLRALDAEDSMDPDEMAKAEGLSDRADVFGFSSVGILAATVLTWYLTRPEPSALQLRPAVD